MRDGLGEERVVHGNFRRGGGEGPCDSGRELVRWFEETSREPLRQPSRLAVWSRGAEDLCGLVDGLEERLGRGRSWVGLSMLIDYSSRRGLHAAEAALLLDRPMDQLRAILERLDSGACPGPSIDGRMISGRRRMRTG